MIKGQQGKGRVALTAVSNRREMISRALRACPIAEWIDVDEFFRFMQAANYYFEVSRDPWDLYICDSEYGSLGYEGYHDWEILQGRYILCLLFEYAATLGMVDVADDSPSGARDDFRKIWGTDDLWCLSRYDGLRKFRLTKFGAYCLGVSSEYSPKPITQKGVIHGDAQPAADCQWCKLSPDEESMLESFAERTAETEWLLSIVRTLKAIEAGLDAASVL